MAIRQYKPTTPGRRKMTTQDFSQLSGETPMKRLLAPKKSVSGRNNRGVITSRRRGGFHKRHYRLVNFDLKPGMTATVETIEYDPNRSAHIARVKDDNGEHHYVIAGIHTKVGQKIQSGEKAPVQPGNRLPLKAIPTGTLIYNIELTPGHGGQLVRGAGANAQLQAKEGKHVQIKLPSGEVRRLPNNAMATIGTVSNPQHQNIVYGKAGRRRNMGRRPKVRGKVMNPTDHPHGGGEGSTSVGRNPKTPWGKPALGLKTRRRKRTNIDIIRSRHQGRRGKK